MRFISVAVPVPFLDQLTYGVPDEMEVPVRGARVVVPLGPRLVTGIVTSTAEPPSDPSSIKPIADTLDDEPFLPDEVLDLALWVGEYYACGAGDAVGAAMPPRATVRSERRVEITERGSEWLSAEANLGRGIRASILAALKPLRHPVGVSVLGSTLAAADRSVELPATLSSAIRTLERDGLVEISRALRGGSSAHKTVRIAAMTVQGRESLEAGSASSLGSKQREALTTLSGSPDGLSLPELAVRGCRSGTIARLARRGLVAIRHERVDRDPFAAVAGRCALGGAASVGRSLTDEQVAAVDRLSQLASTRAFQVALLHGVTGSGKTEVYVRLASLVQAERRSVLVLVPEIALTPAVASTFRAAFGDRVAIQHSGLTDGERYDQWQRIRRGDVSIVVGTRSAVFAPLSELGLIVVDEEHDGSFKQEEAPRYHARDVAVVRGKKVGALVVLGSATPAIETYQNALAGRYECIRLDRRVFDRPLPSVRIVSMREEYAEHGTEVILSGHLRAAIDDRLNRKDQTLVLLNRRGFATAVFCRECASTIECPNCSVSLTVHTERRGTHRARCHYCNYSVVPKACPKCAGPYLERAGFGTERVETEIKSLWPDARVGRLDRDTARRRGAVHKLLSDVIGGDIDVLVGTQMIAKGHDFPRVTLVGVISADVGLGLADFRAAERTFQLLTQVAGRAGRGDSPGEAVIQTLYPDHYSIRHAFRQEYAAFFEDEIRYRRAMRYPPVLALINAVVRAPTFGQAMDEASDIVTSLRQDGQERFRILGPAPAPLGRLRGEYRVQFFLKGTKRIAMREALLAALATRPELRKRVTVDVDPLSVL
ncbi:MAG: replication restart helicase PriA [Vicinamibacterales bacterium]